MPSWRPDPDTQQLNVLLPEATVEAVKLAAELEGVAPRDLIAEAVQSIIASRREDAALRRRLDAYERSVCAAIGTLRE